MLGARRRPHSRRTRCPMCRASWGRPRPSRRPASCSRACLTPPCAPLSLLFKLLVRCAPPPLLRSLVNRVPTIAATQGSNDEVFLSSQHCMASTPVSTTPFHLSPVVADSAVAASSASRYGKRGRLQGLMLSTCCTGRTSRTGTSRSRRTRRTSARSMARWFTSMWTATARCAIAACPAQSLGGSNTRGMQTIWQKHSTRETSKSQLYRSSSESS